MSKDNDYGWCIYRKEENKVICVDKAAVWKTCKKARDMKRKNKIKGKVVKVEVRIL